MSVGYVLINVEPGSEFSVFETASNLPFVVDSNLLFGDHDLILKIEAANMGEIARLVVDSIRSIEGVLNTKTLACAELWAKFSLSEATGNPEKVPTGAQWSVYSPQTS